PPTSTLFPYTTLFRSAAVLTPHQTRTFNGLFNTQNAQLLQQPGGPPRNPGEVRAGDVVTFTNAAGIPQRIVLNQAQATDLIQRRSEEHTSELQSQSNL